jgi:nicotinate dehydrogenase subunit B
LTSSRREFLKGTAALIVSFSIDRNQTAAAQGQPSSKSVSTEQVDGFIVINRMGEVTLYSGKVDLGTGVRTALAQIVAEELDVPLAAVTVIQGDTALTPDQGPTYGSNSLQNGGAQIRQAAATARQALLQLAAKKFNSELSALAVADGEITLKETHQSVSFGALIGGRNFSLQVDKTAQVKDAADFKIVGRSVPRVDIPGKVTGQFTYMQDIRLPDMLHGRVVRPPAIGATLQGIDEDSVKDIPGLIRVVRIGNFVGVVAETEWAAIRASRRLRVSWSRWEGLPDQSALWEHVRGTKVVKEDVTSNVGAVSAALALGAHRLRATYDFTIHTHGSIGPSCSVVEFKDGSLTCWSASQSTHTLRKQLAAMLSMPEDRVRCTTSTDRGAMTEMAMKTQRPMRRCCRERSGGLSECNGCARTSTAGTRKVRPRWWISMPH